MKSLSNGLIIDGFVRKPSIGSSTSTPKSQKITKITRDGGAEKASGSKLKYTAQNIHQRAQKSQTLMRTAVSRPKHQKSTDKSRLFTRNQALGVNPKRMAKAQSIARHSKIQHIGNLPSAVKAQTKKVKAVTAEKIEKVTPKATTTASTSATKAVAHPVPSMVTSVSHQHLERLLDHAFMRADAHKKESLARKRGVWQRIKSSPKWLSIGLILVLTALSVGFYAWHNVPQVAMKVASTRANVKASVPEYTPSGFSYTGPISYSNGSVKMNFKAQGDSARTFSITQKKSNMTSKSLAATAVPKNTEVQTSQVDGNTVYIYGSKNNATWVNNGIQYTIDDKANLNSEQLLKIAGSL